MSSDSKGKLALYWAASCGGCEIAVLGLPYLLAKRKLTPLQQKFGGRLRIAVATPEAEPRNRNARPSSVSPLS